MRFEGLAFYWGFCDFHRSGLFLLLAKSLRWVAADVVFLSSLHSFSFLLFSSFFCLFFLTSFSFILVRYSWSC